MEMEVVLKDSCGEMRPEASPEGPAKRDRAEGEMPRRHHHVSPPCAVALRLLMQKQGISWVSVV